MIFLDTSFLFPLFARHDPDHERVRKVFETYRGQRMKDETLTTNHVIMETVTLVRYKGSARNPGLAHRLAVDVGRALFAGKLAQIHHATPDEERIALEYLAKHRDQSYSTVDCLSFVVMEKLGIREALAVDSDFGHRFVAVPGPLRT